MQEKEFQKLTEDRCKTHNVAFIHVSRIDPKAKGFPDLMLCGTHHMMFAELKLPGNKPGGDQAVWLHRLRGAGQDAVVWYPEDLASGAIDTRLEALCRP